ncbi:hypothetical protein [Streptomyces sp. 4N124]|uniref:hypothetical protein n=1 Tax=Streptomyces sp. 4N124 TaxID=3457420 RepID=UPI003FD15FAC
MLRSTWATWTHGRRRAAIGASAAVVCLGGMLAACGAQGGDDGYVATGSAPQAPGKAVRPTGGVSLVPLDSETSAPPSKGSVDSPGAGGSSSAPSAREGATADSPIPSTETETEAETETEGAKSPRSPATSPPPSSGSSPTTSPAPAALTWSEPEREPTDKRWCEKVTLDFHNSGGTEVRSGTVTFGTHIIGALGIDWGTVESAEKLPVPVGAGARKEKTWTVCVDAWRVPLGMHIETRDVSVKWK